MLNKTYESYKSYNHVDHTKITQVIQIIQATQIVHITHTSTLKLLLYEGKGGQILEMRYERVVTHYTSQVRYQRDINGFFPPHYSE